MILNLLKKSNIIEKLNDDIFNKHTKTYIYIINLQNTYLDKKNNCKNLLKNSNIQSLKNLIEKMENPIVAIDENYIQKIFNEYSKDPDFDTDLYQKCLNIFTKYINNNNSEKNSS